MHMRYALLLFCQFSIRALLNTPTDVVISLAAPHRRRQLSYHAARATARAVGAPGNASLKESIFLLARTYRERCRASPAELVDRWLLLLYGDAYPLTRYMTGVDFLPACLLHGVIFGIHWHCNCVVAGHLANPWQSGPPILSLS